MIDTLQQYSLIHPIELSAYSIISNNLDSLNQSIAELREFQALMIVKLKSLIELETDKFRLYKAEIHYQQEIIKKLSLLEKRLDKLIKKYETLKSN
ncbi:Snn1p SCDLUD_002936 [Saccharomycodes ludwigii]|uniref:Snn1p n=1 Tax=Saccharomycodes ludwigii TaxID=36035 RepID=UPI001E860FF7|nr:hypothetical protein SCDLUD_002936 [Saccharomycodes ludwigii]KAH3901442.1 hypothetical protein SCDLUD_002936 [Saccharomycodes ludwigii]